MPIDPNDFLSREELTHLCEEMQFVLIDEKTQEVQFFVFRNGEWTQIGSYARTPIVGMRKDNDWVRIISFNKLPRVVKKEATSCQPTLLEDYCSKMVAGRE